MRISFGSTRHWEPIEGTRVEGLPMAERPDYDLFRYGGTYYVYNNNRWYSSPRESGEYAGIDERTVPNEFSNVPRERWHNYPSVWQDRNDQGPQGTSATLQVNLGSTPHWMGISGTEVEELPQAERPNYDMFRFRGSYYVHNGDRWYMSRSGSGEYAALDDRDVPGEFSTVSREHWQNYPSGWSNRQGRSRDGAPSTMQVDLGRGQRWNGVRGTHVQMIRGRSRPDYDIFRFDGGFYVYSNDQWYTSRVGHGQFDAIEDRAVPAELGRVPRQRWQHYPEAWGDKNQGPHSENWDQHQH
jgi:hypothetical protein